jgi:TM2 domain-containing membrane protein YozV
MGNNDALGTLLIVVFVVFVIAVIVGLIVLGKKSKERGDQAEMRVSQIASGLPSDKQGIFMMQYQNVRKNPTTALLLALLLGNVGGHKFFLGQVGLGVVYLLFCWTFVPGIIAFIEAFSIAGKVGEYNEQKAVQLSTALS